MRETEIVTVYLGMKENNDNPTDPFGFVDALNFDALDDMDGDQLEQLLTILEKVK